MHGQSPPFSFELAFNAANTSHRLTLHFRKSAVIDVQQTHPTIDTATLHCIRDSAIGTRHAMDDYAALRARLRAQLPDHVHPVTDAIVDAAIALL